MWLRKGEGMDMSDMTTYNFEMSAMNLNSMAYSSGCEYPRDAVIEAMDALAWALEHYDFGDDRNIIAYYGATVALHALRGERDLMAEDGKRLGYELSLL